MGELQLRQQPPSDEGAELGRNRCAIHLPDQFAVRVGAEPGGKGNAAVQHHRHRGYTQIAYGTDNTTTITTNTGRTGNSGFDVTTEMRVFSNIGQLTSVVTPGGYSTTYKASVSDAAMRNKVATASSTRKPRKNFVKNHDIESGTANWKPSNWSGAARDGGAGNRQRISGEQRAAGNENDAGGHGRLLSGQHRGRGGKLVHPVGLCQGQRHHPLRGRRRRGGIRVLLEIHRIGRTGESGFRTFSASGSPKTPRRTAGARVTVTFQVPARDDQVSVYGGITNATGTAYFDCFQLENAMVAGDYNLLTNPQFDSSASWTYTTGAGWASSGRAEITGDPGGNRNIVQTVQINKTGVNFRVSGKAGGISGGSGADHGVIAVFRAGSGGYTSPMVQPSGRLSPSTRTRRGRSSCRRRSGRPRPTGTKKIRSVSFYAIYYKNANKVWFDDLCLNIDATGTAYEYDDKTGNLISASDNAQNKKDLRL